MDFLSEFDLFMTQLTLGALISGLIMFVLSVLLAGLSFGDHDTDFGETDTDFSIDVDSDVDFSIDVDTDIDIGDLGEVGDVGEVDTGDFDSGHDSVSILHDNTPAPLLLLLSTFLLMFGTIGYPLYESDALPSLLTFIISVGSPFFFVKLVSFIWTKIVSKGEFSYEIPVVKIDNQVKTLTMVDELGGLVLADTSDIDRVNETLHFAGDIKMQAKTLPGVQIERDSIAYVIAKEGTTLIIDKWPTKNK